MATEEAARRGAAKVNALYLKFSRFRASSKMRYLSWDIACEDTPLQNSRLVIEEVPVVVHCANCTGRPTARFD